MPKEAKGAALPPLPENSTGIPKGTRYKEQYGVLIVCPDEASQHAIYEGLRALLDCKLKVLVT